MFLAGGGGLCLWRSEVSLCLCFWRQGVWREEARGKFFLPIGMLKPNSSIILEKFYTITDVYVFEQNAPIQRITCLGQNIR